MTYNDEWWNATKGEFKLIPNSWTEKIHTALNSNSKFKNNIWDQELRITTPHKIKLGNRVYAFRFASKSSVYYVSENGQYLIRVSDHWSGAVKAPKTTVCHWIKSCWWTIRGVGVTSHRRHDHGGYLGGIIAFSELERL